MHKLIKQIEQWAEDRNLIKGSTPQKQFLKFSEEIGELITGHNKQNLEIIEDSIGDCLVVLVILSKQTGYAELEPDLLEGFELHQLPKEPYKENELDNLRSILINQGYLAQRLFDQDNDIAEIYNAIGLITYNLVHYSHAQGLDFRDCLQHAYNQIKDRKGKMIDGVFVKEEDLK